MGNVIHQVAAQQHLITCFTFGDVAVAWPTCLLASEILRPHRLGLLFGATRPCCDTVPINKWTRLCKDCLDALAILRLPAAALINRLPVSFVRYFIDEIAGLQSLWLLDASDCCRDHVDFAVPFFWNMFHWARYLQHRHPDEAWKRYVHVCSDSDNLLIPEVQDISAFVFVDAFLLEEDMSKHLFHGKAIVQLKGGQFAFVSTLGLACMKGNSRFKFTIHVHAMLETLLPQYVTLDVHNSRSQPCLPQSERLFDDVQRSFVEQFPLVTIPSSEDEFYFIDLYKATNGRLLDFIEAHVGLLRPQTSGARCVLLANS